MVHIQPIHHDGHVVAFVIGEHALIGPQLAETDRKLVQAKCLYALEIADGQRPGPYSEHSAMRYASHVLSHPRAETTLSSPQKGMGAGDERLAVRRAGITERRTSSCEPVRGGPLPSPVPLMK
jgi:hypothetical protein